MVKKLIKILFLFCFISISTLIFLELIARYIVRQPYYAFPEGYFVSNEFYGYELTRNFRGKYSQPEFTISINTNNEGLRDVDRSPSKDQFKILALGDSFTFGVGVELKDTYLSVLEQMTNNAGGIKLSIIKAGIIGYSTYNEKAYLEKKGLNYHPNMVLVQFWWDDLGIDHITFLAETGFLTSGKITSNAQLRLFLNRNFRSYALLRRIFTTISKKALFTSRVANTTESQSSLSNKYAVTLKEFKEIEERCGKNHISCWFLLIPPKEFVYNNDVLQSQWKSFCDLLSKNNIQYLDCLPVLKEALSKGESVFFKVDSHLNRNGHKIIAEEIYKYLLPKLIPENNN
jgi:lysophospholipase L1-like esterase